MGARKRKDEAKKVTNDDILEAVTGIGDTLEVNGVEYRLSPLSVRSLAKLNQEALRFYKQQYLQTFADTADMTDTGKQEFEQEKRRVAKWTYRDLPGMVVHNASELEITTELITKLKEHFAELPESDKLLRSLINVSLDEGELTEDELGISVSKAKTEYSLWWITSTLEGRTAMVWYSLQTEHPGISRDDVESWEPSKLIEGAIKAELATAPSVGNT